MTLVMKFGGTSVADADRMRRVARIVAGAEGPAVVVTSAMGGVTDDLIRLGDAASRGETERVDEMFLALRDRHLQVADALAAGTEDGGPGMTEAAGAELTETIDSLLRDLTELLDGVRLLREVSPRTADLLVSFGERLAAPMLAAAITVEGRFAQPVDARDLLVASDGFGGRAVDMELSRTRSRAALLPLLERAVPVVTGFIASTPDGHTTTLERGGSDFTATLLGAFIEADEITIWTDVDGVMTADPRVVPEARVLPAITYREAAEMAYFGSKVLHPRTMVPAVERGIPVVIRNTFAPDGDGTRISAEPTASAFGVKTVTSVAGLALVTVEGSGMQGVPGVARRVFQVTAEAGANVYMVSQASSEHNISFVVRQDVAEEIARRLDEAFALERSRGQIDPTQRLAPVGIVAVIGEGMKGTPGISQRMFTALGRGHVNVLAIAQGSSELNLSVVVAEEDLRRAVGAAHSRFGLTRDTHVFLLGKGGVGRALLRQIVGARARLAGEHGIGLEVIGVCGRSEQLLDLRGIDEGRLLLLAAGEGLVALGGEARQADEEVFRRIDRSRWLDVVLVDATAEDCGPMHADAVRHGFHVVTANKKPMAGRDAVAREILDEAASRGVRYEFETTFGAGLPALSTLQDLVATCDRVHRVTGCFSGTLGFVMSELEAGRPFSEAFRAAAERGFTEPDPRDDLSGADVVRKALIIARQLGSTLEQEDVELERLAPPELMSLGDPAEFLRRLPEMDGAMAERVRAARAEERVLRYLAEITPERVRVGLTAVPRDSATGQLSGPDNILVFETDRYREHPLVIRGPGAGAEVTAAGVLGDILKIARAT